MSSNSEAVLQGLIETNIKALKDGFELIQLLSVEQFTKSCEPAFQSSIGVHFRHLLEHYICFLEQWPSGFVSYDQRYRDSRLEIDSNYTKKTILSLCEKLNKLDTHSEAMRLKITDQSFSPSIESCLERELLFLLSHTTHHYAMIAAMTRILGKTPNDGFGVAIATQIYLASTASR